MLKVILRMLADIVFYAITMPIRVVLLLMWILMALSVWKSTM